MYFAFRGVDLEDLLQSFANARYGYLLVYLLFGFLSLLSRAYRWNLLIETLNYKVTFLNSFYALNTGYMANFAFPRIGEITRCATLSKADKVPVDKLFGTVIIERAVDMGIDYIPNTPAKEEDYSIATEHGENGYYESPAKINPGTYYVNRYKGTT